MGINSIKEYLGEEWKAVTETIMSSLQSDIDLLNSTNKAILSNSGKQIRPLMAVLFARACASSGSSNEATIRYAAAAELLHNATLLHDDVADDSDQRRGAPTVKSMMGPSISVLVGDYWLVRAVDLILYGCESDNKTIKIFAKTLSDLAEGEMLQLQKSQSGDTDMEDYRRIIYSKTASLFEASCVTAAISVAAPKEYQEAASDYAVALGMAFQIKDDILDYAGTETIGKPLGVDLLEQKITIPLLGAMENAGPEESESIRKKVMDIHDNPGYRGEIVDFVKVNHGLEYAEAMLQKNIETAIKALDVLPDSYEKSCLRELAVFTSKRDM